MPSPFIEKINSETPTLVDFYADWCGPCKSMKPILDQLKVMVGNKASIIKIDVDKNQKVASTYQVKSVPTLILFKKGKIVWKQTGVISANNLEKIILQHM